MSYGIMMLKLIARWRWMWNKQNAINTRFQLTTLLARNG